MFTYFGSVVLKSNELQAKYAEDGADLDKLEAEFEQLVAKLKAKMSEFGFNADRFSIHHDMYGFSVLHLSGIHNHFAPYLEPLTEWLRANMPGSYGFICHQDDEDSANKDLQTIKI